jgi:hypothetical protein
LEIKVVDIKRGGNKPGTWIHPKLAVPLALWISPEFMLQVSYWVEELLTTGSVSIDSSMMIHELNTQMKIQ